MLEKLLTTSVRRTNPLNADTTDQQPGAAQSPTFITIQSLATFPGAALAVTIIWKFFDGVLGVASRMIPVGAGFLIGAALYSMAWKSLDTPQARLIGALIAVINAMYLVLSVLGIDIGLDQAGLAQRTAP